MCERYVLPDQIAAEREFVPATAWWKFSPRYNVAAQQYVPAIQWHDGQSEAIMMRWGLIPSWAEGEPVAAPPHSIASDRIERSDLHRMPWLNAQRCILPVAGFYAWHLTSAKYRQPYFVRLIDRPVFALAAIWDRSGADENVLESCSVITVPANGLVARIADTALAMPAILKRRDYATWLRGTAGEARAALQPYGSEGMEAYAVSPRINSTAADDAGLIRPAHRVRIVGSTAVHAPSEAGQSSAA
ncbi:MAG TPA: SOS response-associated peptidase [Steroidobacteraceae bacterium]